MRRLSKPPSGGRRELLRPMLGQQTAYGSGFSPHVDVREGEFWRGKSPFVTPETSLSLQVRTDGWMDGWMDRWMDGWTDGWMDRWTD